MDVHVDQAGEHPAARGVQDLGTAGDGGHRLSRLVAGPDGGDLAAVEHQDAVFDGVTGLGIDDGAAFDDQRRMGEGAAGVVGAGGLAAGVRGGGAAELRGDGGDGDSGEGGGAGEDSAPGSLVGGVGAEVWS